MAYDPYMGRPEFIELIDFFDDGNISTNVWGLKSETNTLITESVGYLHFINIGVGAGISHIPTARKFPRYIRASVDIHIVNGHEAADGEHCEASLVLWKDADNWLKLGPYRDTSEVINTRAYLRANVAGVPDSISIVGVVQDSSLRTFTYVLLEHMVMIYVDDIYYTSFEFESLVGYEVRLEAGTEAAADLLDVEFDYFEVQNSFDFATMQIGLNLDYIKNALDGSPMITDQNYTLLSDHFHLSDTTAQTLEFLTNDYGRSFRLDAAFNVTGARVDYCRLYDSSLGTFLNQDGVAADLADGNVYIVPVPGPGVNDYIAFGSSSPSKRLDVVIGPGGRVNVGNTFVWRKMNGAGAQVAFGALTDGTVGFTRDGSVTWTDDLVTDTINGVTAYWVIAKISVAGAATDIPIGSHMQFSPSALVDFDSLGAFGSFLVLKVFRKLGGSYRQQPSDIMYYQQSNLRKDIDVSLQCFSDTKLTFQLSAAPSAAITVNYNGAISTEVI